MQKTDAEIGDDWKFHDERKLTVVPCTAAANDARVYRLPAASWCKPAATPRAGTANVSASRTSENCRHGKRLQRGRTAGLVFFGPHFFITPDGGIVHRLGDVAVYYEDCRSRLARDRSARTAGHSKLMDVERSQGGRGQTRSPVQAGSAMVLHATCWTWERVDKRRKCRV